MDAVGQPHLIAISGATGTPLQRLPLARELTEDWLQELLHHVPGLLPIEAIDDRVAPPLYSLGREILTPVGPIDNLFISQNGYLVLVETKLWRNPEARRVVVAQILDYASHARAWRYSDLERIWKEHGEGKCSLYEHVRPEGSEEHDWIDRVNRGLHEGRMALTIVGDGIRTELHALAAAVGAQPGFQYRLALVEMRLFQIGDQRLVVPVTTIKTVEVERAVVRILRASVSEKDIAVEVPPPVEGRSKRRAIFSEEEFRSELLKLKDGTIKARAADRLLARLSSNLHVEWRSASASIRAAEPTGAGELSLAMLNKSGRFSAYLPWLHGQLTRAWNNEVAVGQAVETHRQFLSQIGLRPTASGEEFFADLTALDGREEEVVSGLENVVAAIARIAAEHEVTAVS